MATFTLEASCQQQTALLELPGLADVFVRNVTIIAIIYFTAYQVGQREAKSSSIVHMVNYIMLAHHMPHSLLVAPDIIIKSCACLKSECSQNYFQLSHKTTQTTCKYGNYSFQLLYLLYNNISWHSSTIFAVADNENTLCLNFLSITIRSTPIFAHILPPYNMLLFVALVNVLELMNTVNFVYLMISITEFISGKLIL